MNKNRLLVGAVLLGSSLTWSISWAETRQLDRFSEVTYALPYEVEFVADDESYVTLEGDEDTIDDITTEIVGDTLKIGKNKSWFDWSDGDIHVTIHYKELNAIAMAGSGDGYAQRVEADSLSLRIAGSASLEIDELESNDLVIAIAGSGNVNLNDIEADSITTKIAGSGDVAMAGSVISQSVSISGSGDHSARELRSQEADISIAGSGDVEVWTLASLNATVMGSGNIDYYGDPKVTENVRGSGNIERIGDEP